MYLICSSWRKVSIGKNENIYSKGYKKTDANFHARLTIHILHSEAEAEDEYNDE